MQPIAFGRPMIEEEERAAVMDVLAGPILVHGPRATQFEKAFASYVGAPHAVSVSSCTAGMHLIYFALGYGPGDEVIVPSQTHAATAHSVELTGAKAVFVDAEIQTGNVDIDQIEAAITPRTKAITVVHYLGMPVDMAPVVALAKRHNLFVLEDCALSIGGRLDGTHTGLLGDAGVFSFYPVKHMTTAEGGMIITRSEALANKLTLVKAFGVDRTPHERATPGVYDVVALGFNYRMSEIHAAIGVEQVKKLDRFAAQRKRNYGALEAALRELPEISLFQSSHGRFTSGLYCLSALLSPRAADKRLEIIQELKSQGVGTSIYYPQPVPRLTHYRTKYGIDASRYSTAAAISDRSIALPVGPHLDETDMATIARALKAAIQKVI